MSEKKVSIAVDMSGGDNAPDVCVQGVLDAVLQDENLIVYAVGIPSMVDELAKESDRIVPVHATEVIAMGEHPVDAIRSKKDSSIVVGAKLVKDRKVDGFFSAGSTGAVLSAATLITGRIKGVKRPAIGAILPGYDHPVLMMDVGANADCKPEMLLQFAKIGRAYMSSVYKVEEPKVGLLNIGEEDEKGNAFSVETNRLLRDELPDFGGNCEGRDLLLGSFDVVVCDGFSGNVALKTIEGTGKLMMKLLKDAFLANSKGKLAAVLLKSQLKELKKKTDSEEQGGSPLLGTKGVFVIGHGSSGAKGIKNGIFEAAKTVRADLEKTIENALK
jgi:phosphate acyltransferase